MKIENYELLQFHPYCLAIPEMEPQEFGELKEDISGSGQLEPIVIFAGQILDGRLRFRACLELGVEPWFKAFDGPDSPLDYVISANLRRRHWDSDKKAMVYAKLMDMGRGGVIIGNQTVIEQSESESSGSLPNGRSTTAKEAATLAGVGERTMSRAKEVAQKGTPELIKAVESGKVSINAAAGMVKAVPDKQEQKVIIQTVLPATATKVEAKRAIDAEVEKRKVVTGVGGEGILLADWTDQPIAIQTHKQFNLQSNDSIGWAAYSWNPITGCTLGCEYCYARDIAGRYYDKRIGFNVAIHPDRLLIPFNKQPKAPNNRVFVGSMTDLFAAEIPNEWIEEVLRVCTENPQFEFMLLTKQPKRLPDFQFPDNCWVGTTTDTQRRMDVAESIFKRVNAKKKWLSVEPMLEPVMPKDAGFVNWYAIGGATDGSRVSYSPPWEWVFNLALAAKTAGAKVWIKDNFWSQGRPMEM